MKALFHAPSTSFDPTFWEELYNLKLNIHKLDNSDQTISSFITCSDGNREQSLAFKRLSYGYTGQSSTARRGILCNVNTVEEFRDMDKKIALKKVAMRIVQSIDNLEAVKYPDQLLPFILLTYADLKSYRFTYWCGIPALLPEKPFTTMGYPCPLQDVIYADGCSVCADLYKAMLQKIVDRTIGDTAVENIPHSMLQCIFALKFPASLTLQDRDSKSRMASLPSPTSTTIAATGSTMEDDGGVVMIPPHASAAEYQMQHIHLQHAELITLEEAWPLRHCGSVYFVIADSAATGSADKREDSAAAGAAAGTGSRSDHKGLNWMVRNFLALLAFHVSTYTDTSTSAGTSSDTVNCVGMETHQQEQEGTERTARVIGLRGAVAKRCYDILSAPIACTTGTSSNSDTSIMQIEHILALSEEELVAGDQSVFCEYIIESGAFATLQQELHSTAGDAYAEPNRSSSSIEPAEFMKENGAMSGNLRTKVSVVPQSLNAVGWETNDRGKPGPRVADLSQALDSTYLMAQAVDLNLRLMKWRLWPALDTDKLANGTRCLLLGAGTLGCAVARALLGWGVRDITFVDNGIVSYSNPARQCLFEYSDCVARKHKAIAAAERLRTIFPGMRSEGVVLSIPMPGHPLHSTTPTTTTTGTTTSSITAEEVAYNRLAELIQSHDVVYVLTDSREARWLPAVMCAAYGKLLLNAALGFDTYLVMRHGSRVPQESPAVISTTPGAAEAQTTCTTSAGITTGSPSSLLAGQSQRLGCYFCNDIVAATNSQRDRSLDQQCTVTRPGLSFIAAALVVEMMVALLHRRPPTAATSSSSSSSSSSAAAAAAVAVEKEQEEKEKEEKGRDEIPHQIRGSVSGFTQFTPHTPAFSSCTACSEAVVQTFLYGNLALGIPEGGGFAFVKQVCSDSSILERVSGVSQLMENIDLDLCIESDDEF